MNSSIPYSPDTEELETLTAGYVLTSRINDIVARPASKRHTQYLNAVKGLFTGRLTRDPKDKWREKAQQLLPRAIEAFEIRHGVALVKNRLFVYPDSAFKIASVPQAIEAGLVGLSFRVRENEEALRKAYEAGITRAMERVAQTHMLLTGCQYWLFCEYWEQEQPRRRVLKEHDHVAFDRHAARDLEEKMIEFLWKTRKAL